MKIITGGAGFIGSAICWRLNLLGVNDIIIVDTDTKGTKAKNIEDLKYSDFMTKDELITALHKGTLNGKVDTLYHMGACSSTTEQDMNYLISNNVEYSKTLTKWSLNNNTRFIYASSAATYGDGEMGYDDSHLTIPKLKPLNKYGTSKQLFDLWTLEHDIAAKVVGLKYFNVYGPNENHKGEMRSMVNKSYSRIKKTGKIELFRSYRKEYKDGEQKRDFIYVKDAVDMTLFFESKDGMNSHGIYNIGTGIAATWNQLALALFNALDLKPEIVYVDMPDNIKDQYQYFTEAKMDKLHKSGYNKPVTKLDEAVKDYVNNYLEKDAYLSN